MSRTDPEETAASDRIHTPRGIAILLVLQGAVFFAVGLAIWSASGRAPGDFLRWSVSDALVALLLGGALIGSMQAIAWLFPRFIAWAAEQQLRLFPHGRGYRPAFVLFISIAAGVGEEALFRGGLQTMLGDHLPAWGAILLASLLFVAVHVGSPGVSAFIFVYSLAFGIIYHNTGSLAGVMLAHAAFDVWAITIIQRELARRGMIRDWR